MLNDHIYLAHHGIKGQKWGVRRFRNENGALTEAGKKRYSNDGGINENFSKTNAKKSLERNMAYMQKNQEQAANDEKRENNKSHSKGRVAARAALKVGGAVVGTAAFVGLATFGGPITEMILLNERTLLFSLALSAGNGIGVGEYWADLLLGKDE